MSGSVHSGEGRTAISGISADGVSASAAALALLVSATSMFYLAKQTKAAAEQTRAAAEQTRAATDQVRISNAVAAVSANDIVLRSLREVHVLMLERPGTREYFYAGRPLPTTSGDREPVITIAELLADVMTSGLHVHEQVPGSLSAGAWTAYCRHTLRTSPVLRELVREHPTWWPHLPGLLPSDPDLG